MWIFLIAIQSIVFAQGDYNRKEWRHWVDIDRDCQNTRAEVLIRDSIIPVTFHTERGCRVKSGEWFDPYTVQFFELASDRSMISNPYSKAYIAIKNEI